ncbi:C39 family peptidase [Atopobium fossor]|uniref:C39 family peptidase n=1 Tax=Atopobium fossor TaxID=39487 RepID=UPI0004049874|nr:C39 family peptidase [Atopobium fossor]
MPYSQQPRSSRPASQRRARQAHTSERQRRQSSGVSSGTGRTPRNGNPQEYSLRGQKIDLNRRSIFGSYNPRVLAILGAGIIVLIMLIVGISSCVRSCTTKNAPTVEATQNENGIAAGISEELNKGLEGKLSIGESWKSIAKSADKYSNERIIELALEDPAAVDFVAKVPTAAKEAQTYSDAVTKDTVPLLYAYDTRWGFVDYANGPLGVTGSGPTALAMTYMSLTGKNDQTPATIAKLATDNNYATGDAFTDLTFFSDKAKDLGLTAESVDASIEEITASLKNNHPIIVLVNDKTFTNYQHYVVLAGLNADGTLNVYDPISSIVSSRPWAVQTILGYTSNKIMVMHPTEESSQDNSNESKESNDSNSNSSAEKKQ